MKVNLRHSWLSAAVSAGVALSLAASSFAATGSDSLVDRQRQVNAQKQALLAKIRDAEARASKLTGQISASDKRKAALEGQIADLTSKIADAESRLSQAEDALGVARANLYMTERSLAAALDQLDSAQRQLSLRAVSSYKMGYGIYLEFLLNSGSFGDFFNRWDFVRKVIDQDHSRLNAVADLSRQLTADRTDAIQRRDSIDAEKSSIEQEKAQILELKDQLDGAKRAVVSEIRTKQSLLAGVEAEKASYIIAMKQLEAESRSIASLLRARQRGQSYTAGFGRQIAWPATGAVTSQFGWRIHPIFGDRRLHTGIDIGAPYGAPVIAAADGTVLVAQSWSGYGNAILIDHGNAFATLYAHLSVIGVSNGQRVTRGTKIGQVGCTGYCTGPHLHFETRINGDPVDPMQFF